MQNKILLIVAALLVANGISSAQTDPPAPRSPTITIDAAAPRVAVSPDLYGIFFEEISHAGDGGLYAELVQNRDFEANTVYPGWRVEGDAIFDPQDWQTKKWFDSDMPGWSLVAEGGGAGNIAQETTSPLNDRNPHSMRLDVAQMGQRCGVANSGYWGMNFQSGEWYDATFYARTENNRHTGLIFSLESADGKTICARATIPEVGGPWKKYALSLHARNSDPKGRLVISPIDPGTLWFDVVSLFPRKTFKDRPNGIRIDLAQKLADLHPGFLRFPGGCVVEGVTLQSRVRWKDSIGDIAQRKGGFDLWGYYNTYGLGFHEYLQLAEDIGAQGVYVINAGQTCQARRPVEYADNASLQTYVQDSLDALEYALGPADSNWGAQRAANGHPEPFKIKYVEIGNENNGPEYLKRYKVFYDAIKARFPQVITIADTRLSDAPMEMVDDHFYVVPARFFRMADYYDKVDRNGPKIYVGEYAVNRGVGSGNLLGALSEAVFMLDLEKNSDVVKMCSYAPLFENVNKPNWAVNLIRLDSSRSVGRTSYQVQKLFSENKPDQVLATQLNAAQVQLEIPTPQGAIRGPATEPATTQVQQIYALAGLDSSRRELVIKVINPTPAAVTAAISLKNLAKMGGKARVITLGYADSTAENTMDKPDLIVPAESEIAVAGPDFSSSFAANSLTIIRLPAEMQ